MANHLLALLSIALLTGCVRYSEVEIVGVQDVQVTRFDATGLSATVTRSPARNWSIDLPESLP